MLKPNKQTHFFPAVVDPDTSLGNLTISTGTPDVGFLSLAGAPQRRVSQFSMEDVAEGRLRFTHTGEPKGERSERKLSASN